MESLKGALAESTSLNDAARDELTYLRGKVEALEAQLMSQSKSHTFRLIFSSYLPRKLHKCTSMSRSRVLVVVEGAS